MITEDYCSFEVAKLLKEKGFDGDTSSCYILEDSTHHIMSDKVVQGEYYESQDSNEHGHLIQAPTHQMAMKWLREREKLAYNILIIADGDLGDLHYSYEIQEIDNEFLQVNGSLDIEDQRFDTYEEACEAGVKYVLENLI